MRTSARAAAITLTLTLACASVALAVPGSGTRRVPGAFDTAGPAGPAAGAELGVHLEYRVPLDRPDYLEVTACPLGASGVATIEIFRDGWPLAYQTVQGDECARFLIPAPFTQQFSKLCARVATEFETESALRGRQMRGAPDDAGPAPQQPPVRKQTAWAESCRWLGL